MAMDIRSLSRTTVLLGEHAGNSEKFVEIQRLYKTALCLTSFNINIFRHFAILRFGIKAYILRINRIEQKIILLADLLQ